MNQEQIKNIAQELHQARIKKSPIEQLSKSLRFDESRAYEIQRLGAILRHDAGEKFLGYKMGLTSEKKRQQMNLHSPLFGLLTDKMQISTKNEFCIEPLIHPKIEPEIAFLIGRDLSETPSLAEIQESISAVYPALEILDSRYTEFQYFSLEDVIADNSSSSHFYLGESLAPSEIKKDLSELKVDFLVDGKAVATGFGRDVSGHPYISVLQQAELLKRFSFPPIRANTLILTGALTAAHPLTKDCTVEAKIEGMPSATLQIRAKK